MATHRRSVTSGEVARVAGVSQSAVSLVISDKADGRVSASTAERIRRVAAELGYAPNRAAIALRTGVVPTLALAVPTATQPFFASVLVAAERRAREAGFSVLLLDSGGDEEWAERLIGMLRGGVLAGAIAYAPDESEAASLADTGLPVVIADVESSSLPHVRFDFARGADEAAAHLVGLGHRRIAYLAVESRRNTYLARRQLFAEAIGSHGAAVVAIEPSASLEFDDAVRAADRLLRRAPLATAVMCDDDLLAVATIRAAERAGRRGISIVGVGDIELARMVNPELTTIGLDADAMGRHAVELLVAEPKELTAPRDDAEVRVIDTGLIVRGSTSEARS